MIIQLLPFHCLNSMIMLRDAWDMAAEICLAQLPALVEDPNAEFQVLKSMLGKDANPELAFAVDIWSVGCTVIEVGSD